MKKERWLKVQRRMSSACENDDAAASVRGIRKESARPGAGVIRLQSRESRNPKTGRCIKVTFPYTIKVNEMRQNKV